MGLGDFLSGVKDAAVNVAKGVAYVADPTHLDDIAEGVGSAASYVAKHPGQTWDTAFEVGRAVVKDQLDPVNLAINAGLLAATVATGGAAAPALLAKVGMGAKSVEAGVAAVKGVDTALDVAKGVSTATKAVEAGSTAVKATKAIEAGSSALKAGETVAEVGQVAQKTGRLANFAQDVKQIGSGVKEASGLERVGKVLDTGVELKGAAREAVGMSRYGAMTERRAAQGNKMLEAAEDMGKFKGGVTKFAAKKVAGEANSLADAGMYSTIDKARHRFNQVNTALDAPEQIESTEKGVALAADPEAAIRERAEQEINERAGAGTGYTDRGQTVAGLYGDSSQTASAAGNEQVAIASGSQVGPLEVAAQPRKRSSEFASQAQASFTQPGQATSPYGRQGPGGTAFGGSKPPANGATAAAVAANTPPAAASQSGDLHDPDPFRAHERAMGRQQHFWEGPRSQWAGGISSNYDWRNIDPLRPITAAAFGGRSRTASRGGRKENTQPGGDQPGNTELNEFGAPEDFAPLMTKQGAISRGQAPPAGELPNVVESAPRTYTASDVRTRTQPAGALGPGPEKRTGNPVIDADSWSNDDYGTDNTGQGYFDFNAMGMGNAMGKQPNTSPMYAPNTSRTSRRAVGAGTLGV